MSNPLGVHRMRRTARSGFSVIELLIVLVIAGILISISANSIAKQIRRDRVVRSATVVAVRDSQLLRLPTESYAELVQRHPDALRQITTQVVRRFVRSYREGEPVPLLVNKVYSDSTQLQYAYYDLPFVCPPTGRRQRAGSLLSGQHIPLNLGEVLREKNLEYVAAGRALGFRRWRLLLGHVLPNAVAPAVIFVASDIVLVILTTAALGFLGLGVRPPAPEWGMMISEGREFLASGWWVATMPGFACMYTGLAFILLGDGVADLLRVKGQ